MKFLFFSAMAAGFVTCLIDTACAQSQPQRYGVPGHGSLVLEVPKEWRVTSQPLNDPASVILRFRPASGEAFYVQVTTIWLDGAKLAKKTPEQLKADVRSSADNPLKQAVEKEVRIDELRGAQVLGYHYSLTDRAPKPGEHKNMTQGMFLSGELLTIFTIHDNDPAVGDRSRVLQMLASASHSSAAGPTKAAATRTEIFLFDMKKERIRVRVPDIPQMQMGPHPNAGTQPHLLYMGSGPDGYTISVLMPTADKGMTSRDCAKSSYRALASRYGLDPKHVVSHQADQATFVMLFPVRTAEFTQFNAYLLSGYRGTHCLEVHISKLLKTSSQEALTQQLASWFEGFRDAKIEPY